MSDITFSFSRSFSTRVEPTVHVQALAAMYGIGISEDIQIVLYENLELTLGPGRIIYITGESGAGKSTLLRDVLSKVSAHHMAGGQDVAPMDMPDLAKLPDKPLIDQFSGWEVKQAGEILNYVGIAEPFVYLRKPRELSDGQRYRFMLARMMYEAANLMQRWRDSKIAQAPATPVIFVDEFLAFLDRETARNVAYQIRRAARSHQLCFVVATTHEDIAADLQANTTVTMRLNLPPALKGAAP